jgi:two-component system sensor histidine kinase/response regulator
MSHELRTPLNAILGFAQLLERDSSLTAGHRRELETIHRSGQHLLALINDVLEISRIEAGRVPIESAPFDLPETLMAIEAMVRVRAEAKGLALEARIAPDLPRYVLGDAPRLRQVLINLLGNAVKFTDRGGVSLHVLPQAGAVRFEVADSGAGIPPEEQERIFQAFYQTDQGAARGEGTGLGLAISRELVRLMGGALTLYSAPDQGTRFSFSLPLPEVSAPSVDAGRGRVIGLAPGQPHYRVLVAEDKPDNREIVTRLLEEVGFEVQAVEDGRQAVAAFQAWQPHFIWMDMRMPVMDGYAATRAIRALPGGAAVKIGALTASAFHEDRAAILAAGCDEMISKPIEEERLFGALARLLGVQFHYAAEPAAAPEAAAAEIRGQCQATLPATLRAELVQAAILLDMNGAKAVVARLRPAHPALAETLDQLLQNFRFDELVRLCRDPEDAAPSAAAGSA